MYAIEFETVISGKTLTIPSEVAKQIGETQHVRIIMLLNEPKAVLTQNNQKSAVKNPIATLLESELIGCVEIDPKLSQHYKAELSKSLNEKYDYR